LKNQCRVPQCERPIHLKRDNLCNAHYLQQRKGQEFKIPRNTVPVGSLICSFEPCGLPQNAKGLCVSHYAQQNTGRPLTALYSTQRKRGTLTLRDAQGRKECARCKDWHDPSSFGPSLKNTDGLRSECRLCRQAIYAENREKLSEARVLRYFNITMADRDQMLADQGGVCATCKTDVPGHKGWVIDHDHSCCPEAGRSCGDCIRGILCTRCNLTLGLLNDDPAIIDAMKQYLLSDRQAA
jgi:hypothetical protein